MHRKLCFEYPTSCHGGLGTIGHQHKNFEHRIFDYLRISISHLVAMVHHVGTDPCGVQHLLAAAEMTLTGPACGGVPLVLDDSETERREVVVVAGVTDDDSGHCERMG